MKTYIIYYRRNLPHYQPPGFTFFVTFRLDGSLPIAVIQRLKEEREKELEKIAEYSDEETRREKYKTLQSQYFGKFDKLLDNAANGPTWLKEEKVATIVKDAIHHYDKTTYDLICYTIMSNHVHIVFTPIVGRDLSRPNANENNLDMNVGVHVQFPIVTNILRLIKGRTARECNKVLNRSGAFWQHESYDHVVRNDKELSRIVNYVLNNPVKAGLCEKWEDWKWNYCNHELLA